MPRPTEPTVDDLHRVLWGVEHQLSTVRRRVAGGEAFVDAVWELTSRTWGSDWRELTPQTNLGRWQFRARAANIGADAIREWAAAVGPARRTLVAAWEAGLGERQARAQAELDMLRTAYALDLWSSETIDRIWRAASGFAAEASAMAGRSASEIARVAGRVVGSFFGGLGWGTTIALAIGAYVLISSRRR